MSSEQIAIPNMPKVAPKQTVEKKLDDSIAEAFKAQLRHDGLSVSNPPPINRKVNETVTSHDLQPKSFKEQEDLEIIPNLDETETTLELLNIVADFLDGDVSPNSFRENVEIFASKYGFSE